MNTWTAESRSVSDGALVVKDAEFNEICVIREKADRSYSEKDMQDQRNARLIAAAPDLLAALIAAVTYPFTAESIAQARAAIAKAK